MSRDVPDTSVVPWESSGWTGNRNVGQMLAFLAERGEIAVVGRSGGKRLWDLSERWYPAGETIPTREAEAILAEKTMRSLGIARSGPGERAIVQGQSGEWRVSPDLRARADESLEPRTTLLSPFDGLIHDRRRTEDLFNFRYRLEIYVPEPKREYGFFVMPILRGRQLVGRVDPHFDRSARALSVNAIHREPGVRRRSLNRPLWSLARFVGAERVELLDSDDRL